MAKINVAKRIARLEARIERVIFCLARTKDKKLSESYQEELNDRTRELESLKK